MSDKNNVIDVESRFELKRKIHEREKLKWPLTLPSGTKLELTYDDMKFLSEKTWIVPDQCRKAIAIWHDENKPLWNCSDNEPAFPGDLEPGSLWSDAWKEENCWPWSYPDLVRVVKTYRARKKPMGYSQANGQYVEDKRPHAWTMVLYEVVKQGETGIHPAPQRRMRFLEFKRHFRKVLDEIDEWKNG